MMSFYSAGTIDQLTNNNNDRTTLWMGELEPWLDEQSIKQIWLGFGENVSVKLIRDKFNGSTAGYCFVDFESSIAASNALKNLNGQPIPNTQRVFRLNWASGGENSSSSSTLSKTGPEYSIFVGDLSQEVTDMQLFQLFQSRYPSCKSAKIMIDPVTNISRGYGFVRFSDEIHMQRALTEMQGFYCGSRPMRISTATPKNRTAPTNIPTTIATTTPNAVNAANVAGNNASAAAVGGYQSAVSGISAGLPVNQFTDPNNTTVFVGGLSGQVTEDELKRFFIGFGDIIYVKIPAGKGCGFVQFVQRHSAEQAITQMQGYPIGNSRVRLSWGRSNLANNNNNINNNNNNANNSTAAYKPQAPPPNSYPMLAQNPHQFNPYSPIGQQPQSQQQDRVQQGFPNYIIPGQDPSEPVPVARLNELYLAARDGRLDRMDGDGHGYHGVYAQ